MKRALISVSDKKGIVEFASKLISLGYEILSTGGTYSLLKKNNLNITKVSDVTGFPEIMDGRVKTLNPLIHGALLCDRDNQKHKEEAEKHDIKMIDILVINLYPFRETVENPDSSFEDIIENIDIGGPAMLRAAAKNHKYLTVLTDSKDYNIVLDEISKTGNTSYETRLMLAQKVFTLTSEYDSLIAKTLTKQDINSDKLNLDIPLKQSLRYGENPHQQANFYCCNEDIITQLHGKELSYNNFIDIDSAIKTIIRFTEPTVAILKHCNPCGIASDNDIANAYRKAFATDTVSPFGGIVITNKKVDTAFVEEINKVFTEVLIATDFDEDALNRLKKKKDRRLITYNLSKIEVLKTHLQIQACLNGYLTQMPDLAEDSTNEWTCPTKIKADEGILNQFKFAWNVVKMLKSNAICICRENQTLGIGIGQTSRIDSMNIAIEKAKKSFDLSDSICASDGFFPFRDSIDRLHEAGIKYVIQPGGSKADDEVVKACDEYGICMIFTGRRHFRH